MKKILIALALVLSTGAFAQTTEKEDLAIIQGLYGKEKTEIMKGFMNLSPEQTTAFQPVYDAYETERKELSRKKIALVDDYAANVTALTDAKAEELTKAVLKNNLDFEKLYSKTFGKAKKAIGAINAAKFIQFEVYLQTSIREVIQDNLPFIDELDNTKKG